MAKIIRKYKNKKYIILIDDEDISLVSKYNLYLQPSTAGKNNMRVFVQKKGYKNSSIRTTLHRLILNNPKGLIDHKNQDPLDNRKINLRIASKSQNAINSKIRSDNTSGYKGVSWRNDRKKWRAYIVINNKQISLGHFTNKHDAANAYNIKALELFATFAHLNEIF